MKCAIVIEHIPGSNYSAYVPALPGCVATGASRKVCSSGIAYINNKSGLMWHYR